jgi:cardiolipin synthase
VWDSVTVSPMNRGHELQLLQSGVEFFPSLVGAIDASTQEVRLETYIFHFDQSGEQVAAALVRAAQRGVAVYLVMDGIGTPTIPQVWIQFFAHAGVNWHQFSPLGRFGLLIPGQWRRLHRKLCVVDARVAFCGGINILDDFVDPDDGPLVSGRFDFSVRVIGPLVADAHMAMVQFWGRLQATRQLERLQWQGARETWKESAQFPYSTESVAPTAQPVSHSGATAALVLRDNVRNRTRIERAYRKAIAGAREDVLIANAYFLPGGKMRRALVHAALRGVRVRLLLHGTYESFMQYHAARPVLGGLLAAGVEIHEYRVGFLHAKVAVVDGRWATVGSSNLDPLSLLLAREANVVIEDVPFARALRARLISVIATQTVQLDPQRVAARPLLQKCLDLFAFGLMRLMLFVTGRRY